MGQNAKDGYARTILRTHEMIHETLGLRTIDHIATHPDDSSPPDPSHVANQLGSIFGTLIVVLIIWFLLYGF
jgi:hypothetical protein